jgi:TPR repeat protein
MISWVDVEPHVCIPMSPEDARFLLRADGGDADAQNDIGQFFSLAGKHEIALFWLAQAANSDHADAMQWLVRYYLSGEVVPMDENLAIMWLAKSAARGSRIAREQMEALRRGSRSPLNDTASS